MFQLHARRRSTTDSLETTHLFAAEFVLGKLKYRPRCHRFHHRYDLSLFRLEHQASNVLNISNEVLKFFTIWCGNPDRVVTDLQKRRARMIL